MTKNDSSLKGYIERPNFTRFDGLTLDEKIVAHWALAFKELLKFNYSGLLECDIDNIEGEQQMKCLSSDKKGGINWKNYMFSEQYDEEDKRTDDKGEIFAVLSIYEALEKYGAVSIGDFVCPPDVLEYVKSAIAEDKWDPKTHCTRIIERYEDMERIAELIVRKNKDLAGQPIMCIAGALASECNWVFKNVLNIEEANGRGSKGTSGKSGAGEGWFGLTFWTQKLMIINKLNLSGRFGIPTSAEAYNNSSNILSSLSEEIWAEIFECYLDMCGKSGKFLKEYNKNSKKHNMEDAKNCIAASFLFKAGEGGKEPLWWPRALERRDCYWATHMRDYGKARDILVEQIYMSMMFARYMKDKKVPSGHPWDK